MKFTEIVSNIVLHSDCCALASSKNQYVHDNEADEEEPEEQPIQDQRKKLPVVDFIADVFRTHSIDVLLSLKGLLRDGT